MMKRKPAGVLIVVLSLLGCNNDVEKPETARRITVDTPRGAIMVQNAVRNLDDEFVTASVAGAGFDGTLRVASTGNGVTTTGGVAELLDSSGQLLFSIETVINRETGEVVLTQATPQDYLTFSIVADDERVREWYDANGDIAMFEYPALSDDTQRRAVNYYQHGLPAGRLPAEVSEYVTRIGEFSGYYEPHSTSTLNDNPYGLLLVQMLSSPELPSLVASGDPDQTIKGWIQQTCSAAQACMTLMCRVNPSSLACFACSAVSTACSILYLICGWVGC